MTDALSYVLFRGALSPWTAPCRSWPQQTCDSRCSGSLLTDAAQIKIVGKVQHNVAQATARLRNLLFELTPPDLGRFGLVQAIKRHLDHFQEETGLGLELVSDLAIEPPLQVSRLMFRTLQEALVNIRKNAHATSAVVTLDIGDGGLLMTISDDGQGFTDNGTQVGHLGLASMRERAEMDGGWWRIETELGQGTRISSWLPAEQELVVPNA